MTSILTRLTLLLLPWFVLVSDTIGNPLPNIVFILADDLGYGDLGCYGHPAAKTPNIDRLAREGVRFTQHYSNGPECSPTRAAFMMGRYQQRTTGLECAIGTGNVGRYDEAIERANQRDLGLERELAVLPTALNDAGYACGVFGKWHLGYEPKFNPIEHGWDEFFGYLGGNVDYFTHRELSELHVLFRGRLPIHRDGYMTHLITDDAIGFIVRQAQSNRPFFAFVSHECPHFPFQGPTDVLKRVTEDNWTEPDAATYVAMLQDLDREVGRIIQTINDAGISDRTILVFASDNGGFGAAAHMGPLRGAKGTTWEGGIRVPLIIRWPDQIASGTESSQVCITFDLTRSFLNAAGASPGSAHLDGYDIISHIVNGEPDRNRTLFWRGRRGNRTWRAVRDGDLKLVSRSEGGQHEEWMYDLASDIGEQNDILANDASETSRLRSLLTTWEKRMAEDRSQPVPTSR